MSAPTIRKRGTTVAVTQEIDFAKLAQGVKDSEEEIHREGGAGRPAEPNPFEDVIKLARKDGKVKELVVPGLAEKKVGNYLRRAAAANGHGLKMKVHYAKDGRVKFVFQAVDKKQVGEKAQCPVCNQQITTTSEGTLRQHGKRAKYKKNGKGEIVENEYGEKVVLEPAVECKGSGLKVA